MQTLVAPQTPLATQAASGPIAPAILALNVEVSFGALRAVQGISLRVERGETVAILGPNGAGKTTTISVLLGLLRPNHGSVRLLGRAPEAAVSEGLVGAVLQDGGLMAGVKVGELLAMMAGLYRAPLDITGALALVNLEGLQGRRVDWLSGGQAQRLRVATALIGDPELLFLDEPTAALDVEARQTFWATMAGLAEQGKTIVFSTHNLHEADDFADRVVVVDKGRVVADGTPSSIKHAMGHRSLRFRLSKPDRAKLSVLPGVSRVEIRHDHVSIRTSDSDATLVALLSSWPEITGIELAGADLEEAFVALTEGAGR